MNHIIGHLTYGLILYTYTFINPLLRSASIAINHVKDKIY